MRSLYGKFIAMTVVIMIASALIAFLAVNTYYHQQLKGQNDEKNMNIAKSIASFIESNEGIRSCNIIWKRNPQSAISSMLSNEEKEATMYGEAFREENLSRKVD